DPTQWNALGHEIGHHIYWNAFEPDYQKQIQAHLQRTVLKAIANQLPAVLPPDFVGWGGLAFTWLNWLEESFADICGAILAGPAFAQSAMALAIEDISDEEANGAANNGKHVIRSDDDHPSP